VRFITNMSVVSCPPMPKLECDFYRISSLGALDKEILEEIFKSLGGRPTIERCKTELDNQFHYIFAVTPEQASGYVCKFRESFLLVGIVSNSALPEPFDEKPDYGSFKGSPFKPNLKNVSGGANIETHSHKLDE
jgi:hypothetical protein